MLVTWKWFIITFYEWDHIHGDYSYTYESISKDIPNNFNGFEKQKPSDHIYKHKKEVHFKTINKASWLRYGKTHCYYYCYNITIFFNYGNVTNSHILVFTILSHLLTYFLTTRFCGEEIMFDNYNNFGLKQVILILTLHTANYNPIYKTIIICNSPGYVQNMNFTK